MRREHAKAGTEEGREGEEKKRRDCGGKQHTFARYSLGISVMLKARAIHGTYSKQKTNQGKGGRKR